MSKSEEFLEEILEELRGMRSEISEIKDVLPQYRATKDIDDIHAEIEGISQSVAEAIEELADKLTGRRPGDMGKDLDDVVRAIEGLER